MMSKCIIVSPGKCAGSAIARSSDDIIYTHGPFFPGFTKTARKIMRPTKRIKVFLFDFILFFKICFANRVIIILRDELSWNEAMFWQDFPQIYLDALSSGAIGNKQDQGLLEDLFEFWTARKIWRAWNSYFRWAFFWFGFKKQDFLTVHNTKRVCRGRVLLIDFDYCFTPEGKKYMLGETGIDLDAVTRMNDGKKKWYAELRRSFHSRTRRV